MIVDSEMLGRLAKLYLQQTLEHSSEDVFTLSRAGNDLEVMKQDAIVHYWFAEIGMLAEF